MTSACVTAVRLARGLLPFLPAEKPNTRQTAGPSPVRESTGPNVTVRCMTLAELPLSLCLTDLITNKNRPPPTSPGATGCKLSAFGNPGCYYGPHHLYFLQYIPKVYFGCRFLPTSVWQAFTEHLLFISLGPVPPQEKLCESDQEASLFPHPSLRVPLAPRKSNEAFGILLGLVLRFLAILK